MSEVGLEELVNTATAAEIMHCSRKTIYRKVKDRTLSAMRFGGPRGAIRIARRELAALLQQAAEGHRVVTAGTSGQLNRATRGPKPRSLNRRIGGLTTPNDAK
jgi:excisionase family DNA binding protein